MLGRTKEPALTLESIADRYWKTFAEFMPTVATARGEHGFDDRLSRFDDTWLDDMGSRFRSLADEAGRIDQGHLSTQDRISIQLLIHECGVWSTDIEHRFLVGAVDPYLGPHTRLLSDTRENTVSTAEQADALLGRYSRIGDYLEDALRFHRVNADQGMTPARASLDRVVSQLDGYLASKLADDPFLQLKLPESSDSDA